MIRVRRNQSLGEGRFRRGGVARGVVLLAVLAVAYAGGLVTDGGHHDPDDERDRLLLTLSGERGIRSASEAARGDPRGATPRERSRGDDHWSVYYSPSEFSTFKKTLEGRYTGVGLWLRDGRLAPVVSAVVVGSPADRAGLRQGDVVLSVDRVPVVRAAASGVADLLRGPAGTRVSVVTRRDGVRRLLSMTRVHMRADDVRVEQLPGGVLHLQVLAFTRGVADQVSSAVAASRTVPVNGVVLDLRGNPGGLVAEAVDVASVFLDSGPVATYERRGRAEYILRADDDGDTRTPLVVLVDGRTASAAELLAAALQDRSRAVIVGARTFGKGVVQRPTRFSDGSGATLTVGRYLTPSGQAVEGKGVEPDVEVPVGSPSLVGERRAVHVLAGLTAAMTSNGRG